MSESGTNRTEETMVIYSYKEYKRICEAILEAYAGQTETTEVWIKMYTLLKTLTSASLKIKGNSVIVKVGRDTKEVNLKNDSDYKVYIKELVDKIESEDSLKRLYKLAEHLYLK